MKRILFAFMCMILSATSFAADKTIVRMETTMGTIELELYPEKASKTVENFLRYTNEGFFNDTVYHRVIKGFMIQGGGFTKNYDRKPTHDKIPNEGNRIDQKKKFPITDNNVTIEIQKCGGDRN